MFVAMLRFSKNKELASQLMQAHNAWIQQGFDDGVFVLVGSLQPNAGGAIVAQGLTEAEFNARLQDDPFVAEQVVTPEVYEINVRKVDPRLEFLLH